MSSAGATRPLSSAPHAPVSHGDETARMIDNEVRRKIDSRMQEVLKALREHQDLLHVVAERLLNRGTIEERERIELIGQPIPEEPIAKRATV